MAFTDTGRLIGEAAKSQVDRNPTNTVFGILSHHIALINFKNQEPWRRVRVGSGDREWGALGGNSWENAEVYKGDPGSLINRDFIASVEFERVVSACVAGKV